MEKENWNVIALYFLTEQKEQAVLWWSHKSPTLSLFLFWFRYKVNLASAKSQEKLTEVKTNCFFLSMHVRQPNTLWFAMQEFILVLCTEHSTYDVEEIMFY